MSIDNTPPPRTDVPKEIEAIAMFTTVRSRMIMSCAESITTRAMPGRPRAREAPGGRSATAGYAAEEEEGTVISWKWSTGTMRGTLQK